MVLRGAIFAAVAVFMEALALLVVFPAHVGGVPGVVLLVLGARGAVVVMTAGGESAGRALLPWSLLVLFGNGHGLRCGQEKGGEERSCGGRVYQKGLSPAAGKRKKQGELPPPLFNVENDAER